MSVDLNTLPCSQGQESLPVASLWTAQTWSALVSLSLTVFALVFSEFLPAGILTPVARSLGVSEGLAGQVVTVTAVTAILGALLIGFAFGRVDRKRVMLGLCALAIASNVAAALAPDFGVLLLARVMIGLAIGGFWSLASAVVARLVSIESIGQGMTVILVGVSAATIAAPPLGALIAEFLSWRAAFVVAAVAAGVALLTQLVVLPRLPAADPMRLDTLVILMKRPVFVIGLVAIFLVIGGHFAGFTYVRVALESIGHLTPTHVAGLLLAFGVANFLGNPAFGTLVDRRLRLGLVVTSVLIGASALTLALLGADMWGATAAVVVWGFAFGGAPLVLQTWTARAASDHLEAMGGPLVAAFQSAIASGAAIGGAIVDHGSVTRVLVFTGILVPAAALVALIRPKWPSPST
jgi:DHA1 family purine ribonucleoside efflux pump-like MFS transporter